MTKVTIQVLLTEDIKDEKGNIVDQKIVGSEIHELYLEGSDYENWLEGKHSLQENATECPNCGNWVAKGYKNCLCCGSEVNGEAKN